IYTSMLLEAFLQSALPGSLSRPLRTDDFILANYGVWAWTVMEERTHFFLQGRPDEGVTSETALDAVQRTLASVGEAGVPQKSLDRLKRRLVKQAVRNADDRTFGLNRATNMLAFGHSPITHDEHVAAIEAVEKANIDTLLSAIAASPHRISTKLNPLENN
ncbi:MAG: hypothetical protein OXR62_12725, partial [Ahrensia sp.]|nr:hypothetical protein [Ahrensia sp.]